MNDRPVVDCAYGYQRENEEETDCGQEGGSDDGSGCKVQASKANLHPQGLWRTMGIELCT